MNLNRRLARLDAALALVEVVERRGFTTWARLYVEGKVGR